MSRVRSIKRSRLLSKTGHYALLVFFGLIFFVPVYYLLVGSLRPGDKVLGGLSALVPSDLSLDNYAGVFNRFSNDTTGYVGQFAGVSLAVTAIVVLGGLFVNSLAGYALARMKWRGRNVVLLLVTIMTIIPFEAVALPLYYMLSGQRNTLYVQALPFLANAFSIFLFYTYFLSIPVEVEEAATIDGAGPLRTLFQVVAPMSMPAYATVAILTFLGQWGQYLWPVLMITDTKLRPLPLELSVFQNSQPPEWGLVLAFGVLFVLPVLVVFLIFQRSFVASVASSGVKG